MVIAAATDVRAGWNERDRADYAALCAILPPLSIRDDGHLALALAQIDALVGTDALSAGAEAYLDALADLVSVYEDRTVELPRMGGLAVLRHLMEERDMPQQELIGVFGNKSTVSEVLRGKRHLTLNHIARLGEFFGVPAGVFVDPPQMPQATQSAEVAGGPGRAGNNALPSPP